MAEVIHQGRNIKRFREMFGIKQEALAFELGEDWNQKKVSLLEAKEVIDEGLLGQVASVLKVPKEAIKNMTDEGAVNIISNTYNDHAASIQYNFNPLEKLMEVIDENKKLYERLVQVEREKNELLQKMIK